MEAAGSAFTLRWRSLHSPDRSFRKSRRRPRNRMGHPGETSDQISDQINLTSKQIQKFWSLVEVRGPDECWRWNGPSDCQMGYGRIWLGRRWRAHRLAKALSLGMHSISRSVVTCHSCDNPSCCNPNHLFFGTHGDNIRDAFRKNRMNTAFGERSGPAKLTRDQVIEILATDRNLTPNSILARRLHVSPSAISLIRRGKNWKHLHAQTTHGTSACDVGPTQA